jgi:hypothetical protein
MIRSSRILFLNSLNSIKVNDNNKKLEDIKFPAQKFPWK